VDLPPSVCAPRGTICLVSFTDLYGVPMQTTSSSAELTSRNATIEIGPHKVFLVEQRYNAVAHILIMGTSVDVASGVQVMKDIVPDDVGIIDLYRFADRTLNLEGPELDRLSRMIDNAAISSGYVDENGNAFPGGLYVKEILSDILRCRPKYRDDILGFAVCSASEPGPSADIGRAIMACCDAWGGAFDPLILHDGAISMAEYVYGAPSDKLASKAYMKKMASCLLQAQINHISRALSNLAEQNLLPQHIFILASLDIAHAYPNLLEKLRKS